MTRSNDEQWYKKVYSAVAKHGSTRWSAIGQELGYTRDDLLDATNGIKRDCDKLQEVMAMKRDESGPLVAATEVLRACETIHSPVIGAVREELQRQQAM